MFFAGLPDCLKTRFSFGKARQFGTTFSCKKYTAHVEECADPISDQVFKQNF
jgi:hypothetical protein